MKRSEFRWSLEYITSRQNVIAIALALSVALGVTYFSTDERAGNEKSPLPPREFRFEIGPAVIGERKDFTVSIIGRSANGVDDVTLKPDCSCVKVISEKRLDGFELKGGIDFSTIGRKTKEILVLSGNSVISKVFLSCLVLPKEGFIVDIEAITLRREDSEIFLTVFGLEEAVENITVVSLLNNIVITMGNVVKDQQGVCRREVRLSRNSLLPNNDKENDREYISFRFNMKTVTIPITVEQI